MTGQVVKGIGGFYYVNDGCRTVMAKARGNLKRNKALIYVGDVVDYEIAANGECVVNKVVKRTNFMNRPPVSNLEMLVVVFATANPRPNFSVIDKLLAVCEAKDVSVAICVSKRDLVSNDEIGKLMAPYRKVYPAICVNGHTGEGIEELRELITGKNVALAGSSGVGKSTITNFLLEGADEVAIGSVSNRTNRGRHTTRHVEIFALPDGTRLYDTPGFTSLDMPDIGAGEVGKLLPEVRAHADKCRFADCMHINEPGCAVKEALEAGEIHRSRYESYLLMVEEVKKWQR